MKFEVKVEEDFPHPVSKVWESLISRAAISQWLMETDDFEPEIGVKFHFLCVDDKGHCDEYRCEVLALEPPKRMVWSWVLAGNEGLGVTEVEFILSETQKGTRVTIYHRGDRDKEMLERFKAGWPQKLSELGKLLDLNRSGENS